LNSLAGNELEQFCPVKQKAPESKMSTGEGMFRVVYGERKLHWGARRTRQSLDKGFPGHEIVFSTLEDWLAKSSICEKDGLGMVSYFEPVCRRVEEA